MQWLLEGHISDRGVTPKPADPDKELPRRISFTVLTTNSRGECRIPVTMWADEDDFIAYNGEPGPGSSVRMVVEASGGKYGTAWLNGLVADFGAPNLRNTVRAQSIDVTAAF